MCVMTNSKRRQLTQRMKPYDLTRIALRDNSGLVCCDPSRHATEAVPRICVHAADDGRRLGLGVLQRQLRSIPPRPGRQQQQGPIRGQLSRLGPAGDLKLTPIAIAWVDSGAEDSSDARRRGCVDQFVRQVTVWPDLQTRHLGGLDAKFARFTGAPQRR